MKYTDSHEWICEKEGTVGITQYAQEELGEVVYIELPSIGQILEAGEEAVVVESTKAAADVYSPVSGTVTAVNSLLAESPELINTSPESDGWLFKIALKDISELDTLLDHPQYLDVITRS